MKLRLVVRITASSQLSDFRETRGRVDRCGACGAYVTADVDAHGHRFCPVCGACLNPLPEAQCRRGSP